MSNGSGNELQVQQFPEITNWYSQCRLCQLAKTNPSILFVVHELQRRGLRGRPLLNKLQNVFNEAGETLPTRQSFARHFEAHCATTPIVRVTKADDDSGALEATFLYNGDDADYETDYTELRSLYLEFKEIFIGVREQYGIKKDDDLEDAGKKKGKASGYDLVMLVKLASELRQMLKTLSDMRNSEKLFAIVLVKHTEQLVHYLSEPIGVTIREVRDRLRRGDDPAEVAEHLDNLVGDGLFPLFESAAKQALEQSRQQYKLH